MKFWVKIVIALLVVVVIGFAVWAFFFREKDEKAVYNRTSEMVEYRESLGIDEKLSTLKLTDYYGDDATKKLEGDNPAIIEINKIREKTLSMDTIKGYDNNNNIVYEYDSYYVVDQLVENIITYNLPYLKTNAYNASAFNTLKSSLSKYNESLKMLLQSIDLLLNCQADIKGESNIEFDVLKGYYMSYYNRYRQTINCASKVIINMNNYINVATFGGEYKFNTKSALYDCYARQLRVATAIEQELEIDYANDCHIINQKINEALNDVDIYTAEYSEYKFLNAYNNLFINNMDVLEYIFTKKNNEKIQMADRDNLSGIREQVQDQVVIMLNAIGF